MNNEDRPFVDGGWGSEYDSIPTCSTCHVPLTGSPTDAAISEEISHHLNVECESILVTTPQKAWELDILFSNASEKNKEDLEKILAKVTFR